MGYIAPVRSRPDLHANQATTADDRIGVTALERPTLVRAPALEVPKI